MSDAFVRERLGRLETDMADTRAATNTAIVEMSNDFQEIRADLRSIRQLLYVYAVGLAATVLLLCILIGMQIERRLPTVATPAAPTSVPWTAHLAE